jgi:ATP-binding cassette subfamily G (WHITE) protein 2
MFLLYLKGTIIFSIHQPRYSIFKLFDSLFLIAAGRCVYHGPARDVLPFFSSVGFLCEEHDNPADFILDISQGVQLPLLMDHTDQIEFYLNKAYIKTEIYDSIQSQINEKNNLSKENKMEKNRLVKKSYLNDLFYLSQRTFRNSFRNPALAILQTIISIFLSILIGLIYLNIDRTIDTGVKNRSGAIFFIVTNQVFSNLSALDLFIKERILFVHENVSGYYHVSTYFLSKIICDIIPLRTIPAIVFSIIVYFMMGFQRSAEKFFIFFFGIWISSICSSSLCFFVSATVQNFGNFIKIIYYFKLFYLGIANLVAALFCVLTLVFGGFLVDISSVVSFLRWIQYFSIFRYAANLLLINEFMGLTLCLSNNTQICQTNGSDILTQLNIDHSTNWDLWKNFVALASITIGFLVLAYVQLRRIKKNK